MCSKREVYRFLTAEVKAYLDEYDSMTVWHMKDLIAGDKKVIYAENVKFISVLTYKGLKIERMITFARNYAGVMICLPVESELLSLHR